MTPWSLDRLRVLLAERAPRDLPDPPVPALPEGGFARASVLVPLFEHEGRAHVLLTRRRADLRRHAGQVSFPGGRIEPGEAPLAAALREAEEEVGLPPPRVEVLGRLDEALVLATAFRLTPWVGVVPYPFPYRANPAEVDALLYVPVAELAREGVHRTEARQAYGETLQVHYYDLPAVTVWGATGRVLNQLLTLWSAA